MSAVTVPSLRYCLRSSISPLRFQRRWARVHDVRFVTTQRDQRQILDRYKDKLEQKAKEEGHESIQSLKEAYQEKISEHRKAASTIPISDGQSSPPKIDHTLQQPPPAIPQAANNTTQSPTATLSTSAATTTTTTAAKSSTKSSTPKSGGGVPGIKPLSSYVDLEKLSGLPRKEIEYIWRLRFASNPHSLCAVIPLETYERIYTNARTHPQFIIPLPRPAAEDGSGDVKQADTGFSGAEPRTAADIHFLQWGFYPPAGDPPAPGSTTKNNHISTVMFTHLAAFKLHGAYAQPHTTVTHHLDLVDSHGIVLLQGAVTEGRGVSPDEATWLLMCLQKFYDFAGHGGGIGREKRQSLLQKFSQGDTEGFKIEELMDEAERVS